MPSTSNQPITLTLPAFTGTVKRLVLANVIVYFFMMVLGLFSPQLAGEFYGLFSLIPFFVVHNFEVWQLATYSFVHTNLLFLLFNMLMLWFLGAQVEAEFGPRWLGEIYFVSLVGAGFCSLVLTSFPLLHMSPLYPVADSTSAVLGLMAGYAVFHADDEMYLYFVLRVKVKYVVAIIVLVLLAGTLSNGHNLADAAQLGGLFFGYAYAKLAPRRGFGLRLSESYYGVRNAWYRRKRKQAAKKFEVYMGKQDLKMGKQDRKTHITDPDKKRDPNDRRWMN